MTEQTTTAARYQLQTVQGDYGREVPGVQFQMPAAKHNGRGHNFKATLCTPDTNCCGARREHAGRLSAQATVIAAYRIGDPEPVLPLDPGDVLEIDGQRYQVRDDVALSDPKLYAV